MEAGSRSTARSSQGLPLPRSHPSRPESGRGRWRCATARPRKTARRQHTRDDVARLVYEPQPQGMCHRGADPMKLLYKPIGTMFGVLAGLVAGAIFKRMWRVVGKESDTPDAKDQQRGWSE